MLYSFQFIKSSVVILIFVLCCNAIQAQFVLKIELRSKPTTHFQDSIFIAGSFNGWDPGKTIFKKVPGGPELATINNLPAGLFEFKITRGSWTTVETATNGTSINNRLITITKDTTLIVDVLAWADDIPRRPPVSTRSRNVFIVDTAFRIPQLQRKRRIWIYLPADYATTKKKYPVLYMHDGQNLFDAQTSSYGEWGADEMMDSVRTGKQMIIVGIDHGESKRLTEYNPYNSRFGDGEGDAYVDFLVKNLKPYIDQTYRTKPTQESTFIAGSSMGGLISLYAVLKYPDVFGAAGIFSPSFWIAPDLNKKIESSSNIHTALYFLCGEKEGEQMTADMKKVYQQFESKGVKKLAYKQVKDGMHNEAFWRSELDTFYQWLNRTIK